MSHRLPILGVVTAAMLSAPLTAQEMQWEDYEPRSTLVVPAHPRTAARFPFVDAHAHPSSRLTPTGVDSLVREMDAMNMAVMVNLSGRSGERLRQIIANLQGRYPDRFVVFANLDYGDIDDPAWGARAAAQLEEDVRAGAAGLKIFKNHGMTVVDGDGRRIPTDDPRFDPVWAMAGELGIPVLIHTADPHQFWEPHDRFNERWFELKERPRRIRPPDRFPPWETMMQEQWNVFRRHPGTTFIAAHLAWLGGDLGRLGQLMDELPNMYTELGAVLGEIGRQPLTARAWFERYQDRVLFGKDALQASEYHVYFRTLETDDEYFDYYRKRHAFWKLYGLALPDSVLQKVYYENAARIIPALDRRRLPMPAEAAAATEVADRIVDALAAEAGEHAIVRYDPAIVSDVPRAVGTALHAAEVTVDYMPFGPVPGFAERLRQASIYVMLPTASPTAVTAEQAEELGRWLDAGAGRQLHFHWAGGTVAADGQPGAHSPSYDAVYTRALAIDYAALAAAQRGAAELLRRGEVRVSTPAGTDLRFRVDDRPINMQAGDASLDAMQTARVRIDREIELPAGVIRVAPIEASVSGVVAIPEMRTGDGVARGVRLEFAAGRLTAADAESGAELVTRWLDATPALRQFREFGLGFNPALTPPTAEPWIPYYGYGAGVVRLSLGDNSELGGATTGGAFRWFLFTDATVEADGRVLVRDGRLADGDR
jgi:predicted TIM-barrel fold metal-dependent hydrolase